MAVEASHQRSIALRFTPATKRRPLFVALPARLVAILLLLTWVGPVSFEQSGSWQLLKCFGAPARAAADSRLIPAGMALQLEPGTSLRIRLHDGRVIEGRFRGRALLDSVDYAPRFAAHVRTSSYVPFEMGETLRVALRDGRELEAPFDGYGELTLLLRVPDKSRRMRVPFESAALILRANGESIAPAELTQAFRERLLPSAEALALEKPSPMNSLADPGADQVAVEDIESTTAQFHSGMNPAGIVVLSVITTVVLIAVVVSNTDFFQPSCTPPPDFNPGSFGVRLTERPFDTYRGSFVGDDLAVADPSPGSTEAPLAAEPGDPVLSGVAE